MYTTEFDDYDEGHEGYVLYNSNGSYHYCPNDKSAAWYVKYVYQNAGCLVERAALGNISDLDHIRAALDHEFSCLCGLGSILRCRTTKSVVDTTTAISAIYVLVRRSRNMEISERLRRTAAIWRRYVTVWRIE